MNNTLRYVTATCLIIIAVQVFMYSIGYNKQYAALEKCISAGYSDALYSKDDSFYCTKIENGNTVTKFYGTN